MGEWENGERKVHGATVVLLAALAGGMGWGIRGQYGHETGAMVPGLLIALVLALLLGGRIGSLQAARAVGLTALGIGFGGSMTYAQTIGLTHDAPLRGNWHALLWGMAGLLLKGALWVGFGGAFLGMGLSTRRYRAREIALLFAGMTVLYVLGVRLFNLPFDVHAHRLPPLYFSMGWDWQPGKADLKPRFENWGGLLLALVGLLVYLDRVRQDRLARNVALWGMLFGGLGWVAAQSLQAYHAWNEAAFHSGWFARLEPVMNWWNLMETTFGFAIGAGLGLGVWRNRALIGPKEGPEGEQKPELSRLTEWALLAAYVLLLAGWEFLDVGWIDALSGSVFLIALPPALGLMDGREFPYAFALPVLTLPIAGKTIRQLCYKTSLLPPVEGWLLLFVLPLGVMSALAWLLRRRADDESGAGFGRWALLAAAWVHHCLNFAFFELPWPWAPLTFRFSNTLIFTACLAALTLAALRQPSRERRHESVTPPAA